MSLCSELDAAAEGIRLYFDKALGSLLLYKFERQQYSEILKNSPNKAMSEVYGAEHLLRLLGMDGMIFLFYCTYYCMSL